MRKVFKDLDRRNSKKLLIGRCDKLWKEIIKLRDRGLCQFHLLEKKTLKAGKDPHHIFHKGRAGGHGGFNTRWDLENGIFLCRYCHIHIAHERHELFRDFLIKRWFKSEDKFETLKARALFPLKPDLKAIELYLKRSLAEIRCTIS